MRGPGSKDRYGRRGLSYEQANLVKSETCMMLRGIAMCNIAIKHGVNVVYYFPGCAPSIEEALIPREFEEFLRHPVLVVTVSKLAYI